MDSPSQRTRSKGPSPAGTPTEPSILAINSVFLGQIFQTRSLKKVRAALHKYADKSGFTLGTSNKTDLSDTVKGRRLVMTCSLGGQSRKQKAVASTGDASALFKKKSKTEMKASEPKGRASSSLKCGCEWEITVKYDPESQHCFVKKLLAVHTNGCNPSPAQTAAVRARRGNTLAHIPLALAVTLRVLLHSRTKPSAIRDLLREHKAVPDSEPIYAQSLINLKLKFLKMGKNLDNWESAYFCDNSGSVTEEDRKTLARFAREWVQDHLNEDNGANVLQFLQELKQKYPGFEYRCARDGNKCLTAWMFMTAEMQFFAKTYGQVLFCDWMKNGVSDVHWPYQGTVVLDENLSVHIAAHALACTESNESYKFNLTSMTSIVPELHCITKVTFSDRLASEHIFFECLNSLQLAALCNWHLRSQNLAEWVKFHPQTADILEEFMFQIQNAMVSVPQLEANIQTFKQNWGGKAAEFMESVEDEIHRFAAAHTHKHLLLFQTGNSSAESGNASIDAFMNENKPHSEVVQTLVQYDTEQNNRERRELQLMKMRLPGRLAQVSNVHVRKCLEKFSDLISQKFEQQLDESAHYSVTLDGTNGSYIVRREGRPSSSSRIVSGDTETNVKRCVCLTFLSSGAPCRHILACLQFVGEPLFNPAYFHPRWERRFDLPIGEQLLEILRLKDYPSEHGPVLRDNEHDKNHVNFDLDAQDDRDTHGHFSLSKKVRKSKVQLNYEAFMEVARMVGESVAPSAELTEAAVNALHAMHSEIRAGRLPSSSSAPTSAIFQTTQLHGAQDTTTVIGNAFRVSGPPKRTRILSAAEKRGSTKRKRTSVCAPNSCKLCNGDQCTQRFCRTLAAHGDIVKPEKYELLLATDIPLVSTVSLEDFTSDPFQLSWEHVVIQNFFADEKHHKYVKLASLDKQLERRDHLVLYTFTALKQWLQTKPKKKLLLMDRDGDKGLTSTTYHRPRLTLSLRAPPSVNVHCK